MSWSGLAVNQTVSYNNLSDGVSTGNFTQKNPIPSSNREMTRSEVEYYVEINTEYLDSQGVLANQLVVKDDLIGYVYFYVNNTASYDITITNVQVNGSTPSGMSFPVTAGNNTSGQVYLFGTASVTVTWSKTITGQSITITDSDSSVQCVSADSGGSNVFLNVAFNGINFVTLSTSAGACI